jgi:hypothetical protein
MREPTAKRLNQLEITAKGDSSPTGVVREWTNEVPGEETSPCPLFAVTPSRQLHSISIESAMWLQLSARTLTPLFDLRQQPGGCVSDSDELVCNRLLLTEEFGRLSLGRSQPGA